MTLLGCDVPTDTPDVIIDTVDRLRICEYRHPLDCLKVDIPSPALDAESHSRVSGCR